MNKNSSKRTLTQADADFLQKQFCKVFATKEDIAPLKDSIKTLKYDVASLRKDLSGVKQDLLEVKKTVGSLPTRKDVEDVVLDIVDKVVIPGMDNMAEDIKGDLGSRIESMGRKFDAQQNRQDLHDKRLKNLESIHPKGGHVAAI